MVDTKKYDTCKKRAWDGKKDICIALPLSAPRQQKATFRRYYDKGIYFCFGRERYRDEIQFAMVAIISEKPMLKVTRW